MSQIDVLIVDDEVSSIEALEKNIDWSCFQIHQFFHAYSAEMAREVIKKHPVRLILCDIEMPQESGLELIEWLREERNLEQNEIECIILTCHPEYSFMRKAMQLGCRDYLLKPVDYAELHRVVEKTIMFLQQNIQQQLADEEKKWQEAAEGNLSQEIVIQKMIPYIQEHLTEAFSVKELAEYVALNPNYAMRLFKKTTGKSILEYVTEKRIELAVTLLQQKNYNNEILAEKTGYISSNYFIRQFKKCMGMTPREYKKKMKR